MSQYAWANPTNAQREQDDDLTRAIGRIQDQLKDPKALDLHAVILYRQQPRFRVERDKAHSIARKKRPRFIDRLRLRLLAGKSETEPDEY
jgi:hypothetical protein